MGRAIVYIKHKSVEYYMEWSTVTDAPVTNGMTLENFEEYYRKEYGVEGFKNMGERLNRARNLGSSFMPASSAEEVMSTNALGEDGKDMPVEEIIQKFCIDPAREAYGTPVTIDQLVGHYEHKSSVLTPEMFKDLLEEYTKGIITNQLKKDV